MKPFDEQQYPIQIEMLDSDDSNTPRLRKAELEELKQLVENEDKIYNEKMQTGEDMITRDTE